jgi:putative endonuclease
LSRWRKQFFASADPSDPRHALGRRGEAVAAKHLRHLGWKVLYRNFRAPDGGEVDLICRDRNTLVFAEVKTRSRASEISRPADNVTPEKERLVARGALAWLKMLGDPEIEFRFDIVEVILGDDDAAAVTVNEAAFSLPKNWRY